MLQTVQEDTVGESDSIRETSPFFSPKKQKTEAGHKVSTEVMLAFHLHHEHRTQRKALQPVS